MAAKIFCLAVTLLLGGCGLSSAVSHDSEDYNSTVEDVTSNILVVNVLRASDGAPLFFSDISQIRGSISVGATATTSFPFGPMYRPPTGTGVRDAAQGALSIATNPTFDIAPSNTKQFYQGILQPLDKNILAYYINRGISARILFNLLFSNIEIVSVRAGATSVIGSIPWSSPSGNEYAPNTRFVDTVKSWTTGEQSPRVVVTTGDVSYGPPVIADARAVVAAKAADLEARPAGKGLVQFSKKTPQTHICIGSAELEIVANSITKAIGADDLPKDNKVCASGLGVAAQSPKIKSKEIIFYRVKTRSVEGIFYYLGALVKSNVEPPIPFHIYEGTSSDARFNVIYRGKTYSVNKFDPEHGEGTLPVLAIINDLLNINRDANEVPTTKAVQAVGAG